METLPFSAQLRAATETHHEHAESSGFIQELLAGEVPRTGYVAMVVAHWHIYQVLEQAAEAMRPDPTAGPFVVDELTRLPGLRADLAHLIGPDWLDRVSPSPATAAYCDRLRQACFSWPAGFIAHHYTRYLGDLSGGQVIRRAVSTAYGLGDGRGVAFYDFSDLGSPTGFKRRYREQLDALPFQPEEQARMTAEVALAYRLNAQVFTELAREVRADPFSPAVVAQVTQHMNEDHAEDSLLIVRALGGQPDARSVQMTGVDPTAMTFIATVDRTEVAVRVPFSRRLEARTELRKEVVRMYRRACAALGVTPRG
ncbi:biliverdin-producing heme oxygenase [Natronosporangium hydrolyticum]|uniref:biliverdin-producing heme oxygenase n=1 Tax=Natronosporangium hydrolyticum TaxID=2811111 RepID=UPI001EFA0911|nr:biliverdin-producing heme oxygenase [Natronosporangium hydrolyticum]